MRCHLRALTSQNGKTHGTSNSASSHDCKKTKIKNLPVHMFTYFRPTFGDALFQRQAQKLVYIEAACHSEEGAPKNTPRLDKPHAMDSALNLFRFNPFKNHSILRIKLFRNLFVRFSNCRNESTMRKPSQGLLCQARTQRLWSVEAQEELGVTRDDGEIESS